MNHCHNCEHWMREASLLRSKQSQHESTLLETMKARDGARETLERERLEHHQWCQEMQAKMLRLEGKLAIAREALEWCGQPYEPDVEFTAPDTQIDLVERQRAAREALEKMGER